MVMALSVALGAAACGHSNPYLRSDVSLTDSTRTSSGDLASRLILVGDAGEIDAPVLDEVEEWAGRNPDQTIVLFLGDNMYPEGMTPRYRNQADARLLPQIEAARRAGARALFIPGNHDWADGGNGGHEAVLAEAAYVNDRLGYANGFLPENGCPGPTAIDPFDDVRIIALDTQWWLHKRDKPTETCPTASSESIAEALSGMLETDRHVVLAAHHPPIGYGRHAGFADWKEYLMPPVIGLIVSITRKLPLRDQDYNSPVYKSMVEFFRTSLSALPPREGVVIWAAGHEHNLQVLLGDFTDYVLISGSAAKTTPVTHGSETLFAASNPGFMILDFQEPGRVRLRVLQPDGDEAFGIWLEPRNRGNSLENSFRPAPGSFFEAAG